MENSLKAIIIGAGVVITMIVVSIGFLLMRQGQSTAQASIHKLDQLSAEMSESQYTMYDSMEISGNEVVNVLKKFKDEYIGICVETKKSSTWYIYNVDFDNGVGDIETESTENISDALDERNNQYINPNGTFLGQVIRDENGRIVALSFVQK